MISFQCFRRYSTSGPSINKLPVVIVSKATDIVFNNCVKVFKMGKDYILGPTADEVVKDIDLKGKTCMITGGNSGIGLEIVRCLISRNCNVMMACRNPYAASIVTKKICADRQQLRFYETNLASLASVKSFSDKVLKDEKNIDIVILNAGVFGLPWTLTCDGLETIFQVNFLSQYYLLMSIEKILSPNARVVFMSSESHRNIKWNIDYTVIPTEDMLSLPKDEYTSIKAYNLSKLCGLLTMHYLGYRWMNTGKSVFCAHPGSFVKTNLCRNWWVYEALYNAMLPFTKSISQAASTPLYCATSPELNGLSALYYKNCKECAESDLARDFQLAIRVNDLARDIIKDRMATDELVETEKAERAEFDVEEPLISNVSS